MELRMITDYMSNHIVKTGLYIEELINDSKNFIYNFFLDEDAPYSFKQSKLNIQHINKMLEGYDPQRFQIWLKDDNIRHYLAEFLNIGSYIAFGNKITDTAFGFGIKFEYILNGELNLLLLGYLKGFHIKLSGIYSLTNPDYYSLGVSGGFLVF